MPSLDFAYTTHVAPRTVPGLELGLALHCTLACVEPAWLRGGARILRH